MTQVKKYFVVGLLILATGTARLPIESALTKEMVTAKLMAPRLAVGTGERIGQTFSVVALGGLRTLVATFMNLRAFRFFTEQKWAKVDETYHLIVDLAPHTRYYWETGSWHQAYNAASYYLYGESDLPPLRRKLAWRESILRGRDFLERGIRNNPDDPTMYQTLGALYSDTNKIKAFGDADKSYEKAYESFKRAVDTGQAREFSRRAMIYALARVPGREREALDLMEKLSPNEKRLPSIIGLTFSLKYFLNPDQDVLKLVDEVFPDRVAAYKILSNQWTRTRDRFPIYGIAKVLTLLEREFEIPPEKSVLRQNEAAEPIEEFGTKSSGE